MWRTHSCVPRRDFFRRLLKCRTRPGVETSLDAARTSAYATSDVCYLFYWRPHIAFAAPTPAHHLHRAQHHRTSLRPWPGRQRSRRHSLLPLSSRSAAQAQNRRLHRAQPGSHRRASTRSCHRPNQSSPAPRAPYRPQTATFWKSIKTASPHCTAPSSKSARPPAQTHKQRNWFRISAVIWNRSRPVPPNSRRRKSCSL